MTNKEINDCKTKRILICCQGNGFNKLLINWETKS